MKNPQVAQIFREIAALLDMEGVPFKPRAYEKAAYAIAALDDPIAEIYARGGVKALETIPGVGKCIAEKIAELLETGATRRPRGAARRDAGRPRSACSAIEGLGPKGIKIALRADRRAHARRSRSGRARRQDPAACRTSARRASRRSSGASASCKPAPGGCRSAQVLPLAREIEARLGEHPRRQARWRSPAASAGARRRSATWTSWSSRRSRRPVMELLRRHARSRPRPRQGARPSVGASWPSAWTPTCASFRRRASAPRCTTSPAARTTTSRCRRIAIEKGSS